MRGLAWNSVVTEIYGLKTMSVRQANGGGARGRMVAGVGLCVKHIRRCGASEVVTMREHCGSGLIRAEKDRLLPLFLMMHFPSHRP